MPNALQTYRAKRDFKRTAEPKGLRKDERPGERFVIQKHAARRLHYDLRLELDGVLLSWAVTRGPSLVPGEKRLAVHVEDHPLDYADFEGAIPRGEYGAGEVIVWDRGAWSPIGDPHKGLEKGHLEFELDGEKLSGRWRLVRMRRKPREKTDNWLLIKGDDDSAQSEGGPDILEERPESVKTGRTIEEVAESEPERKPDGHGKAARPETPPPPDPSKAKNAKRGALPPFVEPCFSTLQPKPPSGRKWLHEIKFDGYRLQARLADGKTTLKTRHDQDWTDRFGQAVLSALTDLPATKALLDGEIVVENAAGASDFSALQADLSAGREDRFIFYAFDLLHLDGWDLRATPLQERKDLLRDLLAGAPDLDRVRFSEHFSDNGDLLLKHACRLSLEGVISKRRDTAYHSGRGKDWVKTKCAERQELTVAGYVPSSTSRQAVGSLALGYYENGAFHYAGRVGSGFSAPLAVDLRRRLDAIKRPDAPFATPLPADEAKGVRFVEPQFVAEIEFRGWTEGGRVRQASFRGLREDKDPREVVRETDLAPGRPTQRPKIELTHPDRLYWPDAGVTKAGLADYYAGVWKWMGPFVAGRPLSLVRCPEGVAGTCFFQKHAWRGMSRNIRQVVDPEDKNGEKLLAIHDLEGLIALVQSAVLEVHLWGAPTASMGKPDWITFDLDPGENVDWSEVVEAAREVRDRLADAGLTSFVKTTGGKGLHVVAPLRRKATWDDAKDFARKLSEEMAKDAPDRFVAVMTKSKRPGKIFIDYLRNARGATAIAPYSSRARPGAAVSMPLDWDELGPDLGPSYFTVTNAPTRLAASPRDPWAGFFEAAGDIPKAATPRKMQKRKAAARG